MHQEASSHKQSKQLIEVLSQDPSQLNLNRETVSSLFDHFPATQWMYNTLTHEEFDTHTAHFFSSEPKIMAGICHHYSQQRTIDCHSPERPLSRPRLLNALSFDTKYRQILKRSHCDLIANKQTSIVSKTITATLQSIEQFSTRQPLKHYCQQNVP